MRGAWIEIYSISAMVLRWVSLPVRGAWIEITRALSITARALGRSPCGERGLKYCNHMIAAHWYSVSLPVRGAWIEML